MAAVRDRFSLAWFARTTAMLVGLGVTASSMSSGFIWASQGEVALVYLAGFFAWSGYIFAHYVTVGVFVNDVASDDGLAYETNTESLMTTIYDLLPSEPRHAFGFIVGIAILVLGIVVLAWYVRQGNHLLGNIGSGLFLGGYVIAHYADAGLPL